MVIPGIIISISGREEAVIIANATFFNNKKSQLNFWVSFPNSTGYEQERSVPFSEVVLEDEFFCTFTLKPIEGGFIKPIQFEIQPVKRMDEVHSFVFPREEFITPTSYPNGFITCVTPKVIFHNCKMHEYGYLGSPVFNFRGDLVAITYLDKGQLQAWTVKSLLSGILRKKTRTLVSNGEQC
uniref:Uncharacterized protein n=1 Tax=Oryza meridionalis TaxID=40149 RepID=A0A0E0EYU7_9ORYZ